MWNLGAASMTTSTEYKSYAEECLRWAEETDNDEHRQAFLDMAVVWMKLAAHRTRANGSPYQPNDNPEAPAITGRP
jgi:hypothetical protein